MPRLTPQSWKILEAVFLRDGFTFVRQASSHRVYEKPGILRPLIIPVYDEIDIEIIRGLLRTAGLSRERYFSLLKKI
jgi:predicted RNA binding protein YcfA (HicA-like mRNA interferase family)